METKTIEVTVRLTVRKDADAAELVREMDYNFKHNDDIVYTEIIDSSTEH